MVTKNKTRVAIGILLLSSFVLFLAGCSKVSKEAMQFLTHGATLSKDLAIKFNATKDFLHSKSNHEEAVIKWKEATSKNLNGTAKGFNDIYEAAKKGNIKDITVESLNEQSIVLQSLKSTYVAIKKDLDDSKPEVVAWEASYEADLDALIVDFNGAYQAFKKGQN